MRTHITFFILISLVGSLISSAQASGTDKKEILSAKLAVIAIGPRPPRRFGSTDGVKDEEGGEANSASSLLPPKPGEIPPRRLHFDIKEKKEGDAKDDDKKSKKELKSINVTFNNPSHFIEVPPGRSLKLMRKDDSELSNYISISPLDPGSMTVVLLRPTGKGGKCWVPEPMQFKINLLGDQLANKRLAIINLSRKPVKTVFHKEKKLIPSGGFVSYESIEGLELHRIAAAYGPEDKIIYNTALRLNKSKRLLFYVLYDSNPNTNDGRTVGLFRTSVDPEEEKRNAQKEIDAKQEE